MNSTESTAFAVSGDLKEYLRALLGDRAFVRVYAFKDTGLEVEFSTPDAGVHSQLQQFLRRVRELPEETRKKTASAGYLLYYITRIGADEFSRSSLPVQVSAVIAAFNARFSELSADAGPELSQMLSSFLERTQKLKTEAVSTEFLQTSVAERMCKAHVTGALDYRDVTDARSHSITRESVILRQIDRDLFVRNEMLMATLRITEGTAAQPDQRQQARNRRLQVQRFLTGVEDTAESPITDVPMSDALAQGVADLKAFKRRRLEKQAREESSEKAIVPETTEPAPAAPAEEAAESDEAR